MKKEEKEKEKKMKKEEKEDDKRKFGADMRKKYKILRLLRQT